MKRASRPRFPSQYVSSSDATPTTPRAAYRPSALDVICLSHLRWNFVFQRPQHLMTRCARDRRVFYVEEPLFDAAAGSEWTEVRRESARLRVVVPHLAASCPQGDVASRLRRLLDALIAASETRRFVLWYWTPMALPFTRHLRPAAVVFDCMDDLSGFAGAPADLRILERELIGRADVVFTGGYSLFEVKSPHHHNVHAMPSSVDVAHFASARAPAHDPADQAGIPRPRLGFFGVIDERMDLALVDGIAAARPAWHVVLVGPTAKIDPATLPRRSNVHYLGMKTYAELPAYLAGWDVALLPFARNEATRFISPTKTPEYLAAGRPVVSTPIPDVVRPYGERGLVRVADGVASFVAAIEAAMREDAGVRVQAVDRFLAGMSWDATWVRMDSLLADAARPAAVAPQPSRTGAAASPPFTSAALLQGASDSPHDV